LRTTLHFYTLNQQQHMIAFSSKTTAANDSSHVLADTTVRRSFGFAYCRVQNRRME